METTVSVSGQQTQQVAVNEEREGPVPHWHQVTLVLDADNQLGLARPAPGAQTDDEGSGDDQAPPIQAVSKDFFGGHTPPSGRTPISMTPINELLFPGSQLLGGLAPGEQQVRPAPGLYDLADADDGLLQVDTTVDNGSLQAYLTETGDFQEDHTEVSMHAAAANVDNLAVGLSYVDSDTEGVQEEAIDNEEQVVEQRLDDVIDTDDKDSNASVDLDPDVDDVTDYKAHEPLDLERMIQMLTELRHRGGDFDGDDMADENDEAEAVPVEGVPAEEVPIQGHLAEPLWTTEEPTECRLKLLQVSVYTPVHMCNMLLIITSFICCL
jgi:hypothetical protein